MLYSEIRNHIINKKYYWYYSIIILISLIFTSLAYINKDGISFSLSRGSIFVLLIFWLSLMSVSCILINIYRCRKFLTSYNNYFNECNTQFIRILIENEPYKMAVPYKSYDATIQSFPKPTNAICIETDDFLLLFLSIKYFGLFQLVLKPFIFIKTKKEFCMKDKRINVIWDFKMAETEQNKTIIFPNRDGIKRLIISVNI